MKNLLTCLLFAGLATTSNAQELVDKVLICEAVYEDFNAYPIFSEDDLAQLEHVASVSDAIPTADKIKLTGIVYQADGVTPAKDVIVYIEQANAAGEYEIHGTAGKNHVHHSAKVKTDVNGVYTFYTFVPGHTKEKLAYRRTQRAQHIHIVVKEPGKEAYELPAFVFNTDWMVTKAYKKRLERRGFDNVLQFNLEDGEQVTHKNIVLAKDSSAK